MSESKDMGKATGVEQVLDFLQEQHKAEEKGEEEFICPICGGTAWWGRADINNHLHCGCDGCGIKVIE